MADVVLVNYGMGNLWSVQTALEHVGANVNISHTPSEVAEASHLVLPGVGSFHQAMQSLRHSGLDESLLEAVCHRKANILGVCLGMQLLGSKGSEDGDTKGLDIIPNAVKHFQVQDNEKLKIPHVGFNSVHINCNDGIFKDLPDECDFYFVHSYRMLPEKLIEVANVATCSYGENFMAAFQKENICATQFHPEKSQMNGLKLLKNFTKLD
jgi:imidazole glycerol-phosphate synthase subunit HisH